MFALGEYLVFDFARVSEFLEGGKERVTHLKSIVSFEISAKV